MARDYPLDVQNVGDDSYCFMSKGHHEPYAFMAAVAEWCADAPLSPPKHLWVKAVPCRCGEHSCHYELSDEARKGWFPATYTWETYGPDAYKPPATAGVAPSADGRLSASIAAMEIALEPLDLSPVQRGLWREFLRQIGDPGVKEVPRG